jgi:serine/threonine protein phosphatase PrpC
MYKLKYNKYHTKLQIIQKGGENPEVGYFSHIGKRAYQEDRINRISGRINAPDGEFLILSIFDGHGGDATSEYLSKTLPIRCKTLIEDIDIISPNDLITKIMNILVSEFGKIDSEMTPEMRQPLTGSTAVMCVILYDDIIVANIADSPAILFQRNGTLLEKTDIHDCYNPDEYDRINNNPAYPICRNTGHSWRLSNGSHDNGLDMTRAFGDNNYKPKAIAIPTIYVWDRSEGDILCICSDSFLDAKLDGSISQQSENDIINEVLPVLQYNNFNPQVSVEQIVNRRAATVPHADNTSMILVIL